MLISFFIPIFVAHNIKSGKVIRKEVEKSGSVWAIKAITGSSEELLAALDKKEWYIPFLNRISTESRKKEWLTVRVLLKELIGEEKEIAYTETGKPFLRDQSFFINISHTRGYVAVAVHPSQPIGIDIEFLSERVQKIKNRFLNETEKTALCKEQELIHLLLHWSAKESLFKILDEQKVDFKECLHIRPFTPLLNTLDSFSAYETRTKDKRFFNIRYVATSDYVLTLAESVLKNKEPDS